VRSAVKSRSDERRKSPRLTEVANSSRNRRAIGGNDPTPQIARNTAPFDPVFPVAFYDLGGPTDPEAAVRGFDDPLARCVMYLLLISRLRDFVSRLDRLGFTLIARVWRGPNGEAWTPLLLEYVLTFAPQDTDPAEFVRMAGEHIDPQAENEMRSLKDALLDQGRRLGRDEGRREGLQEGAIPGNLAILEILGSRFGDATETVRAPLMQIHDPAFLLRLVSVAMKADSIEAFEREMREG